MFHYASLWGWLWDGAVVALMFYWSHEDREWFSGPGEEEEEIQVTPEPEWRAPRPRR